MKPAVSAMTTLALIASASAPALADLVEMTISGSSASSDRFVTDSVVDVFDSDWSFVVVYDTAASWGAHDVSVREAWLVIDGERRSLDVGFNPSVGHYHGYSAGQSLFDFQTGTDATHINGGLQFTLGMDGGVSAMFWGDFINYTLATELERMRHMPVGFTLDDFDLAMTLVDLGQGMAGSSSDLWSIGGEWSLHASSISVRTVPTPAPLAMLAGLGALAARRRR
jgi:MYXO-CTERM domain-containing protein